jgi:hypothetical protein
MIREKRTLRKTDTNCRYPNDPCTDDEDVREARFVCIPVFHNRLTVGIDLYSNTS